MSTASKVQAELEKLGFKKKGNEWRGNNPMRPGSDSNGFTVKFDDDEHGAYHDHVTKQAGSLYDLAHWFGIDIEKKDNGRVHNTKIGYDNLEAYAKAHFCPLEPFFRASWQETTIGGRKALKYPVETGIRARFIDGDKEKDVYIWIGKNSGNCWYGLKRAIQIATKHGLPLILCNGEASTIVAQHYGLPAFCGVGGEGAISEKMKTELDSAWEGEIIIALDCDKAGREGAVRIHGILERGYIIDLGLSETGDLADFCGLYTDNALSSIMGLKNANSVEILPITPDEVIRFADSQDTMTDFNRFVWEEPELFGRTVQIPFAHLRSAGGFANIITTKKVWFIGNVSGGGKTILSETLCDAFNRQGLDVLYIGDEWTPMELTARSVARAYNSDKSTVTFEDFLLYASRQKDLTEQQRTDSAFAMRVIRERKGRTHYMYLDEQSVLTKPGSAVAFLEDVMEAAMRKIAQLRQQQRKIDVIIVDYLSLYDTRGTANNAEEYKAQIFKSYCKALDVLGITTVQVRKESEERVKLKGGLLHQHDLYFLRPEKGNLISTMNILYTPMMDKFPDRTFDDRRKALKPYINTFGQPEPTPNFILTIAKNSVGKPYTYAYFHIDYSHLVVREGIHPDFYYDENYNFPRLKRETLIPMEGK